MLVPLLKHQTALHNPGTSFSSFRHLPLLLFVVETACTAICIHSRKVFSTSNLSLILKASSCRRALKGTENKGQLNYCHWTNWLKLYTILEVVWTLRMSLANARILSKRRWHTIVIDREFTVFSFWHPSQLCGSRQDLKLMIYLSCLRVKPDF